MKNDNLKLKVFAIFLFRFLSVVFTFSFLIFHSV